MALGFAAGRLGLRAVLARLGLGLVLRLVCLPVLGIGRVCGRGRVHGFVLLVRGRRRGMGMRRRMSGGRG